MFRQSFSGNVVNTSILKIEPFVIKLEETSLTFLILDLPDYKSLLVKICGILRKIFAQLSI